MSSIKLKQLIFLTLLGVLFVAAVSCNSKSNDDESEIAVTPALVAVKQFYLKANDSVLHNLDSVAFSIDLNTGVIFNADSLPKGTDVTRLIASITFANTMTKAELSFLKDNEEEVTVNYLTNPEDSIDFTYPVKLDVTAQDGVNSFTYQIKVNIHTQEPDTLIWDKVATSILPSRFSNPVSQKTVYRKDTAYSLIEEYNGEYTLSSCNDLFRGEWSKSAIDFYFVPDIESFSATPQSFWILSDNGGLYSSLEGESWTATGETWLSITGGYEDSILGIKSSDSGLMHTIYPQTQDFIETPVEDGFPVYNASSLGVTNTEWDPQPFAIMAGGMTQEGLPTSAVWAYDGSDWAIINENVLPAVEKPMMARYIVYRDTPYVFTKREMDVWLLFGGMKENGEMNREVYMTYDNGVNWSLAPELMQLPESLPSIAGADVIVAGYELTADLSEAWLPSKTTRTSPLTRTSYTIDGYDITWVCPYMYIFGGYLDDQSLSTVIWRGVLARLEFTPNL
ncbi:MAG: hypothetical protein J1F67_02035 [Muribaculaceae bacterium]|nr:hypothetical protein [Muribaculaceae bacterium]